MNILSQCPVHPDSASVFILRPWRISLCLDSHLSSGKFPYRFLFQYSFPFISWYIYPHILWNHLLRKVCTPQVKGLVKYAEGNICISEFTACIPYEHSKLSPILIINSYSPMLLPILQKNIYYKTDYLVR